MEINIPYMQRLIGLRANMYGSISTLAMDAGGLDDGSGDCN